MDNPQKLNRKRLIFCIVLIIIILVYIV